MKYNLEVKRKDEDWYCWVANDTFDGVLEEFFYLLTQSNDFEALRIVWVKRPDQ